MQIKDNSSEFLSRMKGRSEDIPMRAGVRDRRRVISPGLGGRPRRFTGILRGHDVMGSMGVCDSSGAVNFRDPLPSPGEMCRREQDDKIFENVKKHPESIPKKGDEKFRM